MNVERLQENETNMEVFFVKSKSKNVEKTEHKKKDIILKRLKSTTSIWICKWIPEVR